MSSSSDSEASQQGQKMAFNKNNNNNNENNQNNNNFKKNNNNNNINNNNNENNNNFKRNNNNNHHNKNRMSPLAGVHMMKLGDRMAIINATRELTLYFNSKYEHYGNFIRNEEYSEMPDLDMTYIDEIEGIQDQVKNSLMEKEIIEHRKEIKKILKNRNKMYAELLQVVDEEGLDKLQMIGDFNKLQVLMEELTEPTLSAVLDLISGSRVDLDDVPQPAPIADYVGIVEGWSETYTPGQHTLTMSLSDPRFSYLMV